MLTKPVIASDSIWQKYRDCFKGERERGEAFLSRSGERGTGEEGPRCASVASFLGYVCVHVRVGLSVDERGVGVREGVRDGGVRV